MVPVTEDRQLTRVVVLASGTGTLLQAIITAADRHYTVVGVVTDQPCGAGRRAEAAGIPVRVVHLDRGRPRTDWDDELRDTVSSMRPDLVVSAGFMKILGPRFLEAFPERVINTHPALLPSFPGAHAVPDALAHGVKVSGCTVHIVDEGVDTGPILAQAAVPVLPDDDVDTLHERIKAEERRLIVDLLDAVDPDDVRRAANRSGTP
ncbi:phosphoribosylglycinamide formyltransferase [Corynebacterium sp. CCM 9187]|uniref:Phosphoribosylglycinamide formyltransferase n=1 Tax=Corynebacterium pygosceleis TaxID=2800406 RepID=A0A9Q4C8G9_9CORY|nr:phosphoribosylglycinamide formyltransferase [Corynebacterium pygosceleis]MCK7638138.1 phosphoribosylglycinamide formyltransferase [Corynebacterium pygosceleis]MCK7675852.1 phosphoribosylglycinamide formyltransferase [Corynebacterium pygosceleis]MCL0120766.1 phosphoribosylglycinamide formyltransferase [Corynebacterium pygosceleis]MCX7444307.1 phosphoribosylglycinamide formyltransferase [Corynebacterium pygosceleis]MCX7468854.1 phosphoribosylglycinamide formyltransferase [Corynebacterium pygo